MRASLALLLFLPLAAFSQDRTELVGHIGSRSALMVHCGSQAHFEPLLVDRRGHCRLLRPEAR